MQSFSDEMHSKVIKQLEYYFSDINLSNDVFMKSMVNEDNGWISIKTLMKFNRLKGFVGNNKDLLINVLKKSNSDLIEFNSTEEKIRRKVDKPLPQLSDQLKTQLTEQTVHLSGFPEDLSLDQLIAWSEGFGNVLTVRMDRLKGNKHFNGSAFITFADKSVADNVVNSSGLKFNEKDLIKESMIGFNESNIKAITSEAMQVDWDFNDYETVTQNANSVVIKLIGFPRSLTSARIRKYLKTYAKVVFIRNHPKGYSFVVFANRLDAQKVLDSIKTQTEKVVIAGKEGSAQVLIGDEEKEFWIAFNKTIEKICKRKELKKRVKKLMETESRKRTNSSANSGVEPKRLNPETK